MGAGRGARYRLLGDESRERSRESGVRSSGSCSRPGDGYGLCRVCSKYSLGDTAGAAGFGVRAIREPGQDPVGYVPPARIEHAVVGHFRNDFGARTVGSRRGRDLRGIGPLLGGSPVGPHERGVACHNQKAQSPATRTQKNNTNDSNSCDGKPETVNIRTSERDRKVRVSDEELGVVSEVDQARNAIDRG